MQEEEKKTVDIDTSGPEVDVQLPEEKTEEVVEQPTEDKTYENERETKLEDGGSADDSSEKPVEQSAGKEGGLILADETVERSQVASTCGLVLRMGPHCYDKERYPEGPWCKKGDWIIFARYAGSRIKIDGGEIRLLNDDEVLATVENPEDIFHEF